MRGRVFNATPEWTEEMLSIGAFVVLLSVEFLLKASDVYEKA